MILPYRSRYRLVGVHADLVRVVERAFTLCPPELRFIVTCGLRDSEEQAKLILAGASSPESAAGGAYPSRHLTGHAVDLAAVVAGEVRWDWPLYDRLAGLMFKAAEIENVPLEWGGRWPKLRDGPHFQLPRATHPIVYAPPTSTQA